MAIDSIYPLVQRRTPPQRDKYVTPAAHREEDNALLKQRDEPYRMAQKAILSAGQAKR
jgi:hypothetical protein